MEFAREERPEAFSMMELGMMLVLWCLDWIGLDCVERDIDGDV